MKKNSKNHLGFTMIELLVVVAILGFLAAVVFRNIAPAQTAGNVKIAADDIGEIDKGANRYARGRIDQYTNASIEILSDDEYISQEFGDGTSRNPWGGDYTVEVGSEVYKYVITVTNVPDQACEQLADMYYDAGATCATGVVTINRG